MNNKCNLNYMQICTFGSHSLESQHCNEFDTISHHYQFLPLHQESHFNTLGPRQNGCHFADDIFKCIFVNENVWIPIKMSLKFVPKGPINNIPALVHIMAWHRAGDKPLSEPMMVILPMHTCVTRPQWVKKHSMVIGALCSQTCICVKHAYTVCCTFQVFSLK